MSNDIPFIVYKGKGLVRTKTKRISNKVFVFDLDETIGSFSELYILFKSIQYIQSLTNVILYDSTETLLFQLLDEFPEFFRYGISVLFQYLNEKKKIYPHLSIYIYTNNNCIPLSWASTIVKYIENRWNLPNLFNNVIRCFKIGDTIIEYNRTTSQKTYSDLIRCIRLPQNTELCFIDNTMFPKMTHRHVYYLRPKAYFHYINRTDIINRFISSAIGTTICEKYNKPTNELSDLIINWYNEKYTFDVVFKSTEDMELDIKVSKKLMHHCRMFFYISTKSIKTKKIYKHINANITRKNRK